MPKTLNALITELLMIRDDNPALGEKPVTMADQELGPLYPQDIREIEADDFGTMLA
jgi:hypothetical protein